jgi:hypothetical protein
VVVPMIVIAMTMAVLVHDAVEMFVCVAVFAIGRDLRRPRQHVGGRVSLCF